MILYESPSSTRPDGRRGNRASKSTGGSGASNFPALPVCPSPRHPFSTGSSSVRGVPHHQQLPLPTPTFRPFQKPLTHYTRCLTEQFLPRVMSSFPGRAHANQWPAFMVWVFFFSSPRSLNFYSKAKSCFKHRAAYVISSRTNQETRRNQPGTYISAIS